MNPIMTPGTRLRSAQLTEVPLQVIGTINAYCALLAERAGFSAIYLSGAGVANASYGLPDLGITTFDNVLEDARRITAVTELPLLVDVDTGFGNAFSIARTVKEMIRADVAGIHIEDQVLSKRCGHRPGKSIVTKSEMVDRIKAAVDARTDSSFVIMARTDALAVEGFDAAVDRAIACCEAGADMIFPEAMTEISQYQKFAEAVNVPILANITEFGKTPLFTRQELFDAKVGLILYPLSAFRAMSRAAELVYGTIRREGSQKTLLDNMQTREELYEYLGYEEFEEKLDKLFNAENEAVQKIK
jgi:methylisocitrate lyase